MLNTLWSADEISVKEELKDDGLTSPDSPFHSSPPDQQAPSSPLYRGGPGLTDYHKLSPAPAPDSTQPHYYFAGVDSDNNHLGALLPSFHNLQPEPESPEPRLGLEFPSLSVSELSSPDSSQPPYSSLCTGPHSLGLASVTRAPGPASRKRTNSGSSGSSAHSGSCGAGSGQSRPKIRRRQPLSQEELNSQRNQGEQMSHQADLCHRIKYNAYIFKMYNSFILMLFSKRTRKAKNTELERRLYETTGNCTDSALRQAVEARNLEVSAYVH